VLGGLFKELGPQITQPIDGLADALRHWAILLMSISTHRETSHLINCGEIPR